MTQARLRICRNDQTRSVHYIQPGARSHAEFCSDTCRSAYWNAVRLLGEAELQKKKRRKENETILSQAKPEALIRVKILPLEDQTQTEYWVSGYFQSVTGGDLLLRNKSGQPAIYNLRLVEVAVPLESRADSFNFTE